jgi:polyferredoxin
LPADHSLKSRISLDSVKWRFWRRSIQGLALLLFLALFIASRRGVWPPELINIPIRLDPLTVLSTAIASRSWLPASSLVLFTLLLTIFFGRAWCGWLCPLGTILDLVKIKPARQNANHFKEGEWRAVKYLLLVAILTAALFTNLTLLALDPITILLRTLSVSIWPAFDQVVRSSETFLYQIPFLQNALSNIDSIIRPAVLPAQPTYYRDIFLFMAFFVAILLLNRFASRFWCRYLCPLGGLLGLVSKIAVFKRKVSPACSECGLCARRCPTAAILPERNFASDPGECIMCMQCVEACPRSETTFPAGITAEPWNSFNPQRRQILTTAIITLAGIAVAQADSTSKIDDSHLIRPPGVDDSKFFSQCLRCGECSRACPTSAIQPAVTEAGLVGLWTPLLVMRLGYCDYSCNACGQVCPSQAIPALELAYKRQQVIGKASIDKNRCIAWSERRACIVCEEMCPLPEKAIILDQSPANLMAADPPDLRLPVVINEKCIGCGICEYKCPVAGEASIHVYAKTPGL